MQLGLDWFPRMRNLHICIRPENSASSPRNSISLPRSYRSNELVVSNIYVNFQLHGQGDKEDIYLYLSITLLFTASAYRRPPTRPSFTLFPYFLVGITTDTAIVNSCLILPCHGKQTEWSD